MKRKIGQHTNDELERSVVAACVDLGSVGTAAGFEMWELLFPSVEAVDIGPLFCKAWDRLCNFARSNCAADMPETDADEDGGTELCEIDLVVRGGGSTPSVRDSIDDKAVEEDNVARTLDIFNGAVGVDV